MKFKELYTKYFDTFLLFGSLALLVMWVDQFIYQGVSMAGSYHFIMFALGGFLFYTYRKGLKKIAADEEAKSEAAKKPKKYNYKQGLKKKVDQRKSKNK